MKFQSAAADVPADAAELSDVCYQDESVSRSLNWFCLIDSVIWSDGQQPVG